MSSIFLLALTEALILLGCLFLHLEKKSRGKGTWRPDRERLMLAGASFAFAVVSFACLIISLVS